MARTQPPLVIVALMLFSAAGAAPISSGERRFWPGKERWRNAVRTAVTDPMTWAPAAGAATVGLGGWDSSISDWTVRETPFFGSNTNALEWSDDLRTASHLAMLGTLFLVTEPEVRWKEGARRLIVQHTAASATTTLTSGLKAATDRERPDACDRESSPSGRSSRAFSYAASGRRNLRDSRLPRGGRIGIGIGLNTLAGATAWARVEAGKHHPADVLAGAAQGNFVTVLINEAFLDESSNVQVSFHKSVAEAGFTAVARW